PGAFAYALGSVKRIKDALGILNAGTAVEKLDADELILGTGPYDEFAPRSLFHRGIHRVVNDVEEDLFHLMHVSAGNWGIGGPVALDDDVVSFEIVFPQRQRL